MRVFSAIKIDYEIAKEICKLLQALEKYKEEIRIVPTKNLHITLRFLGNINTESYQQYLRKLLEGYAKLKSFPIVIHGIGFFPDKTRIRVIWVGLKPSSDLQRLYEVAERAACEIGLSPEHRFHGHITVGRAKVPLSVKILKDIEENFRDFSWGTMMVEKVTVFESILHSDGPEYKELVHIPLGGD
ncbi:MAG: RNA 2',3'-cyclic phosphodiesterase [Candidatus Omnitrophica bacterium]|nr:RNA 2',3'-cyclic phosphodiesterase [Candidatus Omnitrophota bacterium]